MAKEETGKPKVRGAAKKLTVTVKSDPSSEKRPRYVAWTDKRGSKYAVEVGNLVCALPPGRKSLKMKGLSSSQAERLAKGLAERIMKIQSEAAMSPAKSGRLPYVHMLFPIENKKEKQLEAELRSLSEKIDETIAESDSAHLRITKEMEEIDQLKTETRRMLKHLRVA